MKKALQVSGAFIFFIFTIWGSVKAAPTKVKAETIPAGYRSKEKKKLTVTMYQSPWMEKPKLAIFR